MNGKRGGKTRSRSAWLVTWMALIAMGLGLSTPPTTPSNLSCALPAATADAPVLRTSGALQNAPAQVCSILPAAGQDSGAQSEARLSGPEITGLAPYAAPTAPTDASASEFTHWEVHQKATGTTEYRGP
jgi:hypothetical protein